jgi:hypothetical protein
LKAQGAVVDSAGALHDAELLAGLDHFWRMRSLDI